VDVLASNEYADAVRAGEKEARTLGADTVFERHYRRARS